MPEKLVSLALSGLLGAGLGWGAQALTLSGRVAAIEAGQARTEVMLAELLRVQRVEVKP